MGQEQPVQEGFCRPGMNWAQGWENPWWGKPERRPRYSQTRPRDLSQRSLLQDSRGGPTVMIIPPCIYLWGLERTAGRTRPLQMIQCRWNQGDQLIEGVDLSLQHLSLVYCIKSKTDSYLCLWLFTFIHGWQWRDIIKPIMNREGGRDLYPQIDTSSTVLPPNQHESHCIHHEERTLIIMPYYIHNYWTCKHFLNEKYPAINMNSVCIQWAQNKWKEKYFIMKVPCIIMFSISNGRENKMLGLPDHSYIIPKACRPAPTLHRNNQRWLWI